VFGSRFDNSTSPIVSDFSTAAVCFGGYVVPYSTAAVQGTSVSHITVMDVRVPYCR